jgi:hypothetical protein
MCHTYLETRQNYLSNEPILGQILKSFIFLIYLLKQTFLTTVTPGNLFKKVTDFKFVSHMNIH